MLSRAPGCAKLGRQSTVWAAYCVDPEVPDAVADRRALIIIGYPFTYPSRVGSSDGAAVPWSAASPAATKKSSSRRACCRQVATTVSNRSANRLPASLSEPKLPFRHRTAGRRARSDTLLVGSTPTIRAKVHSAGHHFVSSRHNAAALRSGFSCPRRSSRPSRAWSGISRRCNSFQSNSRARKRCQSPNRRSISARPQRPIRSASPPRSTNPWKSRFKWA